MNLNEKVNNVNTDTRLTVVNKDSIREELVYILNGLNCKHESFNGIFLRFRISLEVPVINPTLGVLDGSPVYILLN